MSRYKKSLALALGLMSLGSCGSPSVETTYASTTTITFSGTTLPSALRVSTDTIKASYSGERPHQFTTSNVVVQDGFLQLKVPGGQQSASTITCGEIYTTFQVLHASVRTYAILSDPAGVCNRMFFYKNDNQESDIEWISDASSPSNVNGTRVMEYTNQPNQAGGKSTHNTGPAPSDATSAVHEYRLDWSANSTQYFLDDQLQVTQTTNVPSVAGPWVFNCWSNGGPGFTKGPPSTDAIFKIQKIVMYYNTA